MSMRCHPGDGVLAGDWQCIGFYSTPACILCSQFDNRVGYQPRWDVWGRFTEVLL
jgi:hypothetical protein